MSRHPFDPSEVDGGIAPRDSAVDELERYAAMTTDRAPSDLADRVMSAVAGQPKPRRGLLAWLATPPSAGRPLAQLARVTVVAATLVLAVAGALYAGQLAQLIRDGVGSSPSPTVTESVEPTPSESLSPSPSVSPEGSESESPEQSSEPASAAPSATPRPSASQGQGSAQPSPTHSEEESKSPTPSPTPEETDAPEQAPT